MSCRPDLKALGMLQELGTAVNQAPILGHVPGVPIGKCFYSRCEVAAVGLHNHWLNGISYVADKEAKAKFGKPGLFAVSIMVSGGYEDDQDDGTELTYTGQGGNDLLGKRKQVGDQAWSRGNAALRNNAAWGLPVRVTRGNKDEEALYGKVFIYDGLYDVLEAKESVGVSGCVSALFVFGSPIQGQHALDQSPPRGLSTARWDYKAPQSVRDGT